MNLKENIKHFCQALEKADINKDGQIAMETFLHAFLSPKMRMQREQLCEVFYMICNDRLELGYVDWISSMNNMYRTYFSQQVASKVNLEASASLNITASRPDLGSSESNVLLPLEHRDGGRTHETL